MSPKGLAGCGPREGSQLEGVTCEPSPTVTPGGPGYSQLSGGRGKKDAPLLPTLPSLFHF